MGVDGVLRSNFADAMEIQDVRYINALTTEAFHDFQNTKPTIQGLAFHSIIPDGGQDGTKLRVDFSAEAHSEWRYNSSSKHYERWIDASATELEEHIDDYTGGQIVADNLSVLFANHIVDFTIPEDFRFQILLS